MIKVWFSATSKPGSIQEARPWSADQFAFGQPNWSADQFAFGQLVRGPVCVWSTGPRTSLRLYIVVISE